MATVPALAPQKRQIFLSHAGADTQSARSLAEVLRRSSDFEVWFDKDSIPPGAEWMATLEKAISDSFGMIVYIGASGIRAWVEREVRFGLVRNTLHRDSFRFIPVLGEGADPAMLPPFVQQHQCVDLRDPAQLQRLIQLLGESTSQQAIPVQYWTTHSPFRSLQTFGPEDSWLFFGRDRDTDELLERLAKAPTLAVIGNSGSGKSSLIRAGLIPALHSGRLRHNKAPVDSWRIAVFRPSEAPFRNLAETLPGQLAPEKSLAERAELIEFCKKKLPEGGDALRTVIAAVQASSGTHTLLVADQFEEVFTLVADKSTRTRYIDCLLAAAGVDGGVPVHLVLALRADFYANSLDHPDLSAALTANLCNVRRINPQQLREAIENRLALANAAAEPGLVNSLLADVGDEPGNLALLEHALGQLWERSGGSGGTLSNSAYDDIGRLRGALGKHANDVYAALDTPGQQLAQRIFLDLVQLGEGAQDTRRAVSKKDLLHLGEPDQVERVIERLASNRLLTTSRDSIEVSHEALIREWPSLRKWLEDNREDLRLGRLLQQAAEEWSGLNRDPSALLQGIRLTRGEEWRRRQQEAPPLLDEFIDASRRWQEEASARDRERRERDQAQSRELAAQAEQMLAFDQPLALHLAIRGWRTAKTGEAHLAVARAFPQLLAKLEGHTAEVRHAAFSPDGRNIVTASDDGTARVWNVAAGQPVFLLEGHTGKVVHAAFSPDGQRFVTASDDHTARVWNARDGHELATIKGHSGKVVHASFSPDGQRILTASHDNTALISNAINGRLFRRLEWHGDKVEFAAFSPDGLRVVTASTDRIGSVWNPGKQELPLPLKGHRRDVIHAAFSPDGKRIVTSSFDRTARVWNTETAELLRILEGHTENVWHAEFSPDGRRILTASADGTARLWNADNYGLQTTLEGHTSRVVHAEFSPEGQHIVTASFDRSARVWNADNGQLLALLEGHSKSVGHASFSPDAHHVVTASADNTAHVWNLASAELLVRLAHHVSNLLHAAFSPDGQRVVTASVDCTAGLWNANNGELLAVLRNHTAQVEHAAFSPDSQRIVTASLDNTARVWNVSDGQCVATLKGHTGGVCHTDFSPDGQHIVTASHDKTAIVWDAGNFQRIASLEGIVNRTAFSPDSQFIVTASGDKTARVWNVKGELVRILEGHTAEVGHAAFSPDGSRIVTAARDKTARLWSADNGQLLTTLEGHTGPLVSAAFSSDNHRIVSASLDQKAIVWNASDGQALMKLEGHTGGVWHVAFSPDGLQIVTCSHDNTSRVWNASNGQPVARLDGHDGHVNHASFSPDGQRVLTASADRTARIYRMITLIDLAKLLAK